VVPEFNSAHLNILQTNSGGVANRNRDDGRVLTDQEGRVKRDDGDVVNFSDQWDLTTKNMMLMLGSLQDSSVIDERAE